MDIHRTLILEGQRASAHNTESECQTEEAVSVERGNSKSAKKKHILFFALSRKLNISSLSDTPDRKKSDTLTAKILHPFRIDGAWRPHGLRTAATPLDHSEIAFSRLMDSPLMVST